MHRNAISDAARVDPISLLFLLKLLHNVCFIRAINGSHRIGTSYDRVHECKCDVEITHHYKEAIGASIDTLVTGAASAIRTTKLHSNTMLLNRCWVCVR
uniref:Uncharacterized protein n=1 Tax=Anopheles funestus TaxID=62324 RepID=A0A182RE47_ANOFN